ncbi:helix-turn-helix domain-containing protein [Kribbella sp. NBC_01505]|uniref:helix-turn-helix domain-containing protein n=1 Tax=Kribbella sp. NBC_01505 TaxID=2903580 RepID=UPI003862E23C
MAGVALTQSEMTFARRVKQYRQTKRWTQLGLADQLRLRGVSLDQAAVARIEKGQRRVLLIEALCLSQALGCPISELMRPVKCEQCSDLPPPGFTCQACGESG